MSLDMAVVDMFVALRHPVLTSVSLDLTSFGALPAVLAIFGVIYVEADRDLGLRGMIGATATAAIVLAVKLVVRRPAPPVEHLDHLLFNSVFPSGHTATAFFAATYLSLRDLRTAPLFLLAAVVGLTRIYQGVHYPSDVIAGAAIGIAVALAARRLDGWLSP
ncbi:MAG: phosphatase PAP2 family protein [Candidatus Nanohaloarchaea archaeon]